MMDYDPAVDRIWPEIGPETAAGGERSLMKYRRMFSRILAVLIIVSMLAAALSSCGDTGTQPAAEPAAEVTEPEVQEEAAEPEPVPQEEAAEPEEEEPAEEEMVFDSPWKYYVTEEADAVRYDLEEVVIRIPLSWKDEVVVKTTEYGLRFADKASAEKWEEKGMDGGTLFYLELIGNGEEFQGPDYDTIGSTDRGQYILIYPSDVQAYYEGGEDTSYMDRYAALYEEIGFVAENSNMIER